MKMTRILCLLHVVISGSLSQAAFAAGTNASELRYKETGGPSAVETSKFDWQDQKRDRNVPVKIYYPKAGAGPFPVIIFSHGLGGSRDGYEYLGQHWASHGYVSVHVQHLGSDSAVWQDVPPAERLKAMQKSTLNLKNATERPRDVSFAIDQLVKLNQEAGPMQHRLDLDRIGVAGHSFGSFTTLAIAGEVFPTFSGGELSAGDPRVKAAIAMSSPVPRDKSRWDAAFAKIHIPCFHMTGTKDDSPIGDTKAEVRRVPFDHIKGADQFLVTFQGGDHMIFSGRTRGQGGGEKDEVFHRLILMSSTAFWDAYLKGDAEAKTWLAGTGFASALKENGKFEKKLR
jgi:dienelactone hydrolase